MGQATMLKIHSLRRRKASHSESGHAYDERSPAIVTNDLQFVYSNCYETVQVLQGLDLQVQRGIVHIIMGPSGAGKTTLLLVLAGLLTPTAGRVTLLGQCLQDMSRQQLEHFRLQHMGFVSEDLNLFSALTALDNVAIALQLKGIGESIAQTEAMQRLEQVGLAERASYLPRSLSGGQQQRLAIARAMAGQPDLLLADEPTSALDTQNGRRIMALFHQMAHAQGCTVCLATHDARTLEFADHIDYLEDGRLKPND